MARFWRLQILLLISMSIFITAAVVISWAGGAEAWVRAARVQDVSAQKPLYNEDLRVYVVRSPDGLLALSGRGPWRDEKVGFCVTSRLFEAPFSGSKFDRYGNYYGGPAPRSMTRFPVRVEDGAVLVQPQEPIEGPERGAVTPLEPEGPLCLGG